MLRSEKQSLHAQRLNGLQRWFLVTKSPNLAPGRSSYGWRRVVPPPSPNLKTRLVKEQIAKGPGCSLL